MDQLTRDLRFAWRGIRHQPAFAAAIVVMLALGIGAAAAIFTVVQAVILKIPFDEPGRIVLVRGAHRDSGESLPTSYSRYLAWREAADVFDAVGAYTLSQVVSTGASGAVRLSGEAVTASMFNVLGARPALGRTFLEAEDRAGGTPVVILSHEFWTSSFGADPGVLGQPLVIEGVAATIIGVMSNGFEGPRSRSGVHLWVPLAPRLSGAAAGRDDVMVYARLRPGVSPEAARARLDGIARGLPQSAAWTVVLRTLRQETIYAETSSQIRILSGAVGLVLLMACVNVASLLLGRNVARRRELAIRLALGAKRRHILRHLVTESLMLSCIGAAGGLVIAWWAVAAIVPFVPGTVPRIGLIRVDLGVVAFAAVTAAVTGLLVAVWPAWSASRGGVTTAMKAGDGRVSGGARRARTALVVVESALAMILLTAAAFFISSFLRLNPSDPGFNPDKLTTFSVRFGGAGYADSAARRTAVDAIAARLGGTSGVTGVSGASSVPLWPSTTIFQVRIAGAPVAQGRSPTVHFRAALPRFLSLLEMPILRGRDLDERDTAAAEATAVVNEAFARSMMAGREALNAVIEIDEPDGRVLRRIVGVVRDARIFGTDTRSRPEVYVPYAQCPRPNINLVVQSEGPRPDLERAIRSAVRNVDASLPVDRLQTLSAIATRSVALPRFFALLMGAFAAVALILACLGLYGVAAWSVTQRTREIGVRMALGARPSDIRKMVLRYGAGVGAIGALVGSAGSFASAKMLESWLFGLPPRQPVLVLGLAASFLLLVTAACYLPARRAMRIDPMHTLRTD